MTSFQRARQPGQKEQRKAHLVATARSLLAEGTALADMSLSELARQAGVSKASVYTYFETREALLLDLLREEWGQWFDRIRVSGPGRRGASTNLAELVRWLARSLVRSPLLCALTAALPTVIERNLSEESIRSFKRDALALFRQISGHLFERAPVLSAEEYTGLLHDAVTAIIGIHPSTHPPEPVARALEDPSLAFFRRDFGEELSRLLMAFAMARVHAAAGSDKQGSVPVEHVSWPAPSRARRLRP